MWKILIVEDEQETREGIKKYLTRAFSCEVEEAADGDKALQKITAARFDLIILDIRLPGLSGIDILKKTKDKNLKFLIISGYDSLSVAEEALNEGAQDYLTKPFSMDLLSQKVKQLLGNAG
ncbi:response regulator [Candidatus Omnitrophota bacterium]